MKNYVPNFSYTMLESNQDSTLKPSESKNILYTQNEAPWTSPGMNYADILNQAILLKLLVDSKQNLKTKNIEQIVIDYRIKKLILNPMNIK